ncbi:hypothetical protein B0H10DRAFT_576856 [Mycena sp. CBHHK59/15]|nr:hypothetical protein B0H10DRAFT_576856 [Mycena sp. CBHHK59/15]
MFFRLILCLLSASILASSAAVTGRDDSDWKHKVGWSGVVSPASSIGTLNITTTDTTLAKRNIGGIYICTDINWKGDCGYAVQPVNTCINMGSEWYRKISSLGPDPGTRVQLFGNLNCQADTFGSPIVTYPGYGNLNDIGWNDHIASFYVTKGPFTSGVVDPPQPTHT